MTIQIKGIEMNLILCHLPYTCSLLCCSQHLAMSEKETTYLPPLIPKTPSRRINMMLDQRCSQGFNKLPNALLGYYICIVFTAINTVYYRVHRDTTNHSFVHWGASCLVIVVVLGLTTYVVFHAAHLFVMVLSFIGCTIASVCTYIVLSILKFSGIAFSVATLVVVSLAFALFDKDASKSDWYH